MSNKKRIAKTQKALNTNKKVDAVYFFIDGKWKIVGVYQSLK